MSTIYVLKVKIAPNLRYATRLTKITIYHRTFFRNGVRGNWYKYLIFLQNTFCTALVTFFHNVRVCFDKRSLHVCLICHYTDYESSQSVFYKMIISHYTLLIINILFEMLNLRFLKWKDTKQSRSVYVRTCTFSWVRFLRTFIKS